MKVVNIDKLKKGKRFVFIVDTRMGDTVCIAERVPSKRQDLRVVFFTTDANPTQDYLMACAWDNVTVVS